MAPDTSDRPRDEAIDQLESLGLSTYAARTFVALTRLGQATAREVSEASNVPRTRVYDATQELCDRGLVDIQHSSPKHFHAVSVETAGKYFEHQYVHRVNRLTESLGSLEAVSKPDEQRGVWTVTGHGAVTDRIVEFIDGASEEIVYMTVGDLMNGQITERLRAAGDRGVDIRLAEMSDTVEDQLYEDVPSAESFESIWDWEDTHTGRLLMVDRERTLVSVVVPTDRSEPADRADETAIWGSGEANGLVIVLRNMFTWELDGERVDS